MNRHTLVVLLFFILSCSEETPIEPASDPQPFFIVTSSVLRPPVAKKRVRKQPFWIASQSTLTPLSPTKVKRQRRTDAVY